MKSYTIYKTSKLGEVLLAANDKELIGLYFLDCEHAPVTKDGWERDPKHPVLKQVVAELDEYLEGKRTKFTIPLHCEGTDFQKEIWRQIARIPFGETISYSELAQRAGAPDAIRAAGTATGSNRIGIIIPCHRVVAKGGGLGGYAGGLERKKHLLELEMSAGPLLK